MNNLFILTGRIAKDLELKYTKENKAVLDTIIAVPNGKDDTSFIKVTIWNKTAETTAQYCKKGDLISATGIIKNHNWEDEKGKHYDYTFLVNKISFLSTKKETLKKDEEIENDIFAEYGEQVEINDSFLN